MAEGTNAGGMPSLAEALRWIGFRVDEMGGQSVARVQGIYVDGQSGKPEWVICKVGRFGKVTALPVRDCAGGAGHLWTAHTRDQIRGAPQIDASGQLTREAELEILAHYGVGEGQGRVGELASRAQGEATAVAPAEPSAVS